MTKELIPTGKLRLGVPIGPDAGIVFASRDASGRKGVSITLADALAKKLGVPVEFIDYPNSGDVVAAADKNAWDVAFVPADAERRKAVSFAASTVLSESTYLVGPGAAVKTLADMNRAGIRIVGVNGTATIRASQKASSNATHIPVPGPAECEATLRAGKADAIALGRETLLALAATIPGARVLEEAFLSNSVGACVSNGKPQAREYVRAFIEEAKASGVVRRALDALGLKNIQVAPSGMEP